MIEDRYTIEPWPRVLDGLALSDEKDLPNRQDNWVIWDALEAKFLAGSFATKSEAAAHLGLLREVIDPFEDFVSAAVDDVLDNLGSE